MAGQAVRLDAETLGLMFEGIGTVSNAANSRLWMEYPEPQMSQMLDLVFKPKYGMSYHHFKIEIGSDMNSSCGTEPAIMRSREEYERVREALSSPNPRASEYLDVQELFDRGYEFRLAQEAKKRNPSIMLDCLQWGAPGWVGERSNGNIFSEDNANMLAMFIKGADIYKGLRFDYVGGDQNEMDFDKEYIKTVRRVLDANALEHVRIVIADINDDTIGERLNRELGADEDFRKSVYAIGSHYHHNWGRFRSKHGDLPLWCGEDGFWFEGQSRELSGALFSAHKLNINYLEADYVKNITCNPVISNGWYNVFPMTGYMLGHEPWSGRFEVIPVTWAVAHTTQFAEPGWQYLAGEGCGVLPGGGTYVTLKKPGCGDFSIIIETQDAGNPQQITFVTAGLSTAPKHVWATHGDTDETWFQETHPQLAAGQTSFTLELLPNAIYTITTTTGQRKGTDDIVAGKRLIDTIPASVPFPFPYHEDFEKSTVDRSPRFFTDIYGYFEVIDSDGVDGSKQCLQQKATSRGIVWASDHSPLTMIGSPDWADYEVGVSAKLVDDDPEGFVTLVGRAGNRFGGPTGYCLKVGRNRKWSLSRCTCSDEWTATPEAVSLAEGELELSFDLREWHNLALKFSGEDWEAYIDGKLVTSVSDGVFSKGAVGFGSSFNNARFDDLFVRG